MKTTIVVNPKHESLERKIEHAISNFDDYKDVLGAAERNVIKNVIIDGTTYTIKSFKIPNFINKVVYRFFRKSKAERSYTYANTLLDLGINTPEPIAYQKQTGAFFFLRSFYISEFIDYDLTYRELTTDFTIKDHEAILRAFTRFTYKLHENGVHFLDHSPGNTLIKRNAKGYDFYLVDLNRMKFGKMDFETRVKNFAKLTIHKSMVTVMSNEYAKCTGEDETEIFDAIWTHTKTFQEKYYQKIRLKKRIFFWKKKYKNRVAKSPIS
ncbi:lipopolysaccharide kinase InaA family protein [Hyunsoonleella ulvae]|uniref:lipopolysaccharide kinase InaA family protein n=1 Tax=Hyunsoonleella ulvae TaxID=2799948 RepID=UPI001939B436|nr:lipopolysaccharide kinase InaA family protein [Hyunsoonleella ulvae]